MKKFHAKALELGAVRFAARADEVVETGERVAGAGFRERIREVQSFTPLDLEQQWGLTEGDLNHGQLILDQLFFMRPMMFACANYLNTLVFFGFGALSLTTNTGQARITLLSL